MPKVADVKLGWNRSVSTDLKAVQLSVAIDGNVTTTDLPPETQEFMIVVGANKSFSFQVKTIDTEGLEASSELYASVLGDLEAPQPATSLFHEVVAIRDEVA